MKTQTALRASVLVGASLVVLGAAAFVATHTEGDAAARTLQADSSKSAVANAAGLVAAALDPAAAGADPLQVEPRLPRAAGTPCVVNLLRDSQIPVNSIFSTNFTYTPPAGCPGAWAKVKLIIELEGPRQNGNPVSALALQLTETGDPNSGWTSGALWAGAPQMTDDVPAWHLERDVTEYASLLRTAHPGILSGRYDNTNFDFDDFLETPRATALLVFYPATAQTPAQRVADLVVPISSFEAHDHLPIAAFTGTFPRNIERAYLDVVSHVSGTGGGGNTRYWYACAPDAVLTEFPYLRNSFAIGDLRHNFVSHMQGCGGGNYREVEVRIDGRLAGLAPVFPWLGSSINNSFRNTVDTPAPAAQALNWMPFRVDLTPFAGLLNNGAEHTVQARLLGVDSGLVSGHLVLYRDRNRAIVPGAVTSNTLAESTPSITDTLVETTATNEGIVTRHLTGEVSTRSVRSFRIAGYVDTSRGRIVSTVVQRNYFVNRNIYDVLATGTVALWEDFEVSHDQKVRLTSSVDVTSRRTLGTTLLNEDKSYTSYPFTLDYLNAGAHRSDGEFSFAIPEEFSALVHQARVQRTSQFRRGTARFDTSLRDVFDGTREFIDPTGFFNWGSARDYLYTDNRGGCYSAGLTTMDGVLETRTRGDGCSNGVNSLRWYSHPDGSPDSMNWAPAP